MLVTKQLTVAIDFHSMDKKYHGSQWLPSTLFKILSWVNYYLFNSHFSIQKLISSHYEICILICILILMFAYLNVIGPFDFASIDSSFWHIIINIYILSLSFFFYLYLVVLTKASITIAHT